MDNKEQEKKIASFQFYKNKDSDDYPFLVQKLKIIKKTIESLEKSFIDKGI